MKSLAPNTLLQNRYLVVHLIGKGGMGDVYLAVDQRLGSAVALKRTFFADDEMLGNAFEREAKTLARLRHPVLPKVSDHFTEGGEQYLVMEHISGEDLSKRLEAANKSFPFSWVLFWADQLLDALSYLHSHEPPIIHRDIKPQNLKLTDENHIILLDFGLSKNNIGESRVSTGSTASVVGYTPHYAPMEQVRGTGTDPRSDIYSLSATIYQLLTNVVPPDALTRADSMLNGLADPVKPIYEINPEVSKQVSDVILKGMEVSQERRYKSAREMQKILRDAYAQMQSAMTAHTMAFNVQDAQTAAPSNTLPTEQKTEVLNAASTGNLFAADSQPKHSSGATGGLNDQTAMETEPREPNFDATLKMDAPAALNLNDSPNFGELRQADVKTEVFLADANLPIPPVPAFVANQNADRNAENFAPTENFSATENFAPTENYSQNNADHQNFAPNATVPLFALDDESARSAGETDFNSSPAAQQTESLTDFSATRNFSSDEFSGAGEQSQFDSQPQPVKSAPPVKKSSAGKILGIVAGFGALFLLIIGAGGAGYWYYTHRAAAVVESTTPLPTVEFSPTPFPTPENTPDVNTNSSVNSASNVGLSNSDSGNSASNGTTANEKIKTTVTPTPAVDETPRTNATPKPTPVKPVVTPPVRQTPKSTPKPTDRTVILQ